MTPVQFLAYGAGAAATAVSPGCICGLFAQCMLNKGLQYCHAGPGVLVRNLEVPMAYVLGMLFLNETPTLLRAFGSFLVVCAAVIIGMRQFIPS